MTDLDALANIADIVSALTVVGGGAFALIQLQQFRTQRRHNAAAELMRSFYSPEFARAVRLIRQLPDECPAADLRARGAQYEEAALIICTMFETIGLLVFKGVTPFSMAQDLTGGLAVVMWRKLQRWMLTIRVENAQPSWAEWFQWVAERFRENAGDKEVQPAYVRFAVWRPRS